jgi:hypothetical protein
MFQSPPNCSKTFPLNFGRGRTRQFNRVRELDAGVREAGMHDSPLALTAATLEHTSPALLGRTMPRGRVCIRAGCGKLLIGNDGRPIYDRNFCSQECRRADKRERMQEKRRKARSGRCPHCGRKFDRDSSSDGSPVATTQSVPCHNAMTRSESQDGQMASANRP